MIKKNLKPFFLVVAIIIFAIFFIYFFNDDEKESVLQQDVKEVVITEEPPNVNNEVNAGNETDNDANNENTQVEKEKAEVKYYINQNYFIKPVNEQESNKVVLLTFDDAPQGDHTLEILDILDKYNAKAIFFINGHYAVKHEDLVKEIYNRGHVIGNHTWWHENLKELSPEKTVEEIVSVNDLVEELTGERPKYFRPPFGAMSDNAKVVLNEENMQSMNWSLGSLDWEYTKPEQSQQVVDQVLNNLLPGSNILMHDKEVTALALDKMLQEIQAQGYSFVLPTEHTVIEVNQ